MKKLLLILVLGTTAACSIPATQGSQRAQRRPMQRSSAVLETPKEYTKRTSGESAALDPKPRVETADAKAGKYYLKWVGHDGKEKVVEYQRADAIDAVVSATVSRTEDGRYLYTYVVKNLPSSPTYLSSFTVQNFARDARPVKAEDVYVGSMSSQIQEFAEGAWFRFADSYLGERVTPGQEAEMRVVSSAPPGVVGCRVTAGNLTLKGVGEHMPTELENAMPGYEEWPKGYTVGPVGGMNSLSRKEGVEYVLSRMPLFEQLGWVTPGARRRHEERLRSEAQDATMKRAESDLQSEQITSEVHALLRMLKEK